MRKKKTEVCFPIGWEGRRKLYFIEKSFPTKSIPCKRKGAKSIGFAEQIPSHFSMGTGFDTCDGKKTMFLPSQGDWL